MSSIESEPRPGTAFKTIDEEQAMLDEFMAMVATKLEIDERHLDNLTGLQDTWNENWRNSGIWSLISPMVTYLEDEIEYLRATHNEISARFQAVPRHKDVPESTRARSNLHKMNESLRKAYSQCQECVRNINAPEAQEALATAKEIMRNWGSEGGENKFWRQSLPSVDCAYRLAVRKQHFYVKKAGEWYKNTAPVSKFKSSLEVS